jgi:2-methylcitrate dehydratase PrpD
MTKLFDLAQFVVSITDIPASVTTSASRALYDLVGVAAAGSRTQGGMIASRAISEIFGTGSAGIWFSTNRSTCAGAAFVNAVYGSMLDLDDGHRRAAGHPGASIVPAVLAAAQTMQITPQRALTAIAIGYEVGTRVSASRDFSTLRTTDTGQWCGIGVAAAIGWLRNLPAGPLSHAMAIAGHTACGQFATGWTRLGHMAKEGIAWATAGGITAVGLAQAGFTGPLDMLDDPLMYDQERLTGSLGASWAIEASYIKIYSACRWAHGPVDAVLALKATHGIGHTEIEEIEIATFGRALTLINASAPQGLEAAQYSIPFCVALAAVHGPDALLLPDLVHLSDDEVLNLAAKVRLTLDPELDPQFPAATPCRVRLRLANGKSAFIDLAAPKGEPSNPIADDELKAKFLKLAVPNLGMGDAIRLEAALSSFAETSCMAPLFEILSHTQDSINGSMVSCSASACG